MNVRRRFVQAFLFPALRRSNRMTLGSTNLKLKFIFRMPVLMGIQKRAESLARLYMCSKSLNLFAAVLIGPSSDVSAGHRKIYISCASINLLQGT